MGWAWPHPRLLQPDPHVHSAVPYACRVSVALPDAIVRTLPPVLDIGSHATQCAALIAPYTVWLFFRCTVGQVGLALGRNPTSRVNEGRASVRACVGLRCANPTYKPSDQCGREDQVTQRESKKRQRILISSVGWVSAA
jgi:hypothetical protein